MSDRPTPAATEAPAPQPASRPVTYIRIEPRRLRQAVVLTLGLFAGFLLARWALTALGGFLLLVDNVNHHRRNCDALHGVKGE